MSETLSYQAIRSANQARETNEMITENRKKNILILVLHYLTGEGYRDSSQALSRETNINLDHYEVADNVDLETVLQEYESYYYIKFNKYPKITKKLSGETAKLKRGPSIRRSKTMYHNRTGRFLPQVPEQKIPSRPVNVENSNDGSKRSGQTTSLPRLPPSTPPMTLANGRPRSSKGRPPPSGGPTAASKVDKHKNGPPTPDTDSLALHGLVINGSNNNASAGDSDKALSKPRAGQIIDFRSMLNDATRLNVEEGTGNDPAERLLKPLGGYMGYSSEWRDLAQVISRDIFSENPNVKWDDIIGLDNAKRLAKESVVYPIKYPQMFKGILSPWKGLLLYGPPGTGKTLLAKAVATECKTTFFNISASSIVSKWRGDSEKLVRVLFEMARFHAPSTIFLDELESLMSQRGSQGGGGEHEGSRRMKTELLVQMDGLAKSDDLVFLLAASNLPWELDHAMLRRLEKRILVDLPTEEARRAMFYHHLPPKTCMDSGLDLIANLDYDTLAAKTEGYSGSDIRLVCKEAAMRPVRKIFDALETHNEDNVLHIKLDPVCTDDALVALQHTKPSARTLASKYFAWQAEYESV